MAQVTCELPNDLTNQNIYHNFFVWRSLDMICAIFKANQTNNRAEGLVGRISQKFWKEYDKLQYSLQDLDGKRGLTKFLAKTKQTTQQNSIG